MKSTEDLSIKFVGARRQFGVPPCPFLATYLLHYGLTGLKWFTKLDEFVMTSYYSLRLPRPISKIRR